MKFNNVAIVGNENVQNLFEGEIEPDLNLDELEHRFRTEHSLPPAMSLYTLTKHTPISKSLITDLSERWRQCAETADVVVVVGAQPYFKDAHIWDPIVSSSAHVWYISGMGGDFDRLSGDLGSRLDMVGRRFDESLRPLLERLRDLRDASLVVEAQGSS